LEFDPHIYDTQRVMRIIGSDGQPSMETIDERKTTDDGVLTVLNDVTVGEYDVVMDTGPGFMTKRQQAVDAMMPLMAQASNCLTWLGTWYSGTWTFLALM